MNRAVVAVTAIAVATLVDYVSWIAWAQGRPLKPDGSYGDPYQPWQIVGLVIGLIVIAAVAGWHDRASTAIGTVTVVLTLSVSVDWATDPPAHNDGLWGVGAIMVAIATCVGVAFVSRMFRPTTRSRLSARR
jgi:hypothetical protein